MPRTTSSVRPVDIASDGGKNLLIVTQEGQLHLSRDGARNFTYIATLNRSCQGLLMRGETIVAITPDGPLLWAEGGFREVFGASSHALDLAIEPAGAVIYAGTRVGEGWVLVRIPLAATGQRPAVVSKMPVHLGAPRFVCATATSQQTELLVGLDEGFVHMQVPSDQE